MNHNNIHFFLNWLKCCFASWYHELWSWHHEAPSFFISCIFIHEYMNPLNCFLPVSVTRHIFPLHPKISKLFPLHVNLPILRATSALRFTYGAYLFFTPAMIIRTEKCWRWTTPALNRHASPLQVVAVG